MSGVDRSEEGARLSKVGVVIVTFNNVREILECVESILDQGLDQADIVIVDNASSDATVLLVQEHLPMTRVIQNENNIGFAGGCNIGIAALSREYVALVNPDTCSDLNWLPAIVDYLKNHSSIGAAQPKILMYSAKDRISSSGNSANLLFFAWPDGYMDLNEQSQEVKPILYASGAAAIYSRSCLAAAKGFDAGFFMYEEDVDLGIRSYLLGFGSVYVPSVHIYHKYEYRESRMKYFFTERNRLYMVMKTYHLRTIAAMIPAIVGVEIAVCMKALAEGWLLEKVRGYGSILTNLRSLIESRRFLQSSRKRGDSELLHELAGGIFFSAFSTSRFLKVGNPLLEKYKSFLLTLALD